jgi:hypothetical protein
VYAVACSVLQFILARYSSYAAAIAVWNAVHTPKKCQFHSHIFEREL